MVTLHSVGRMAQKLLKTSLSYSWKSYHFRGFTSSDSLLLRRFTVFRMVEASAKRGVTGDEQQGTMGRVQTVGEACCLLPAFLCAHIFIVRETSGCEAVSSEQCY